FVLRPSTHRRRDGAGPARREPLPHPRRGAGIGRRAHLGSGLARLLPIGLPLTLLFLLGAAHLVLAPSLEPVVLPCHARAKPTRGPGRAGSSPRAAARRPSSRRLAARAPSARGLGRGGETAQAGEDVEQYGEVVVPDAERVGRREDLLAER